MPDEEEGAQGVVPEHVIERLVPFGVPAHVFTQEAPDESVTRRGPATLHDPQQVGSQLLGWIAHDGGLAQECEQVSIMGEEGICNVRACLRG
jgi:hypothetical protein